MTTICCDNVSIRYKVGDFKNIGIKEYVLRKIKGTYHTEEFWANKDITFQLESGDMLGIIGRNGAGKTTLLKAISGVMEPTKGHVSTTGKIVSLLELASGFDGDLTVKENAYLRGAMLGYSRKFMDMKYEEILEYSGLKDFESRMFKHLSSGMQSRLAFSVASVIQPDILILDEVLSVGDEGFREKSERKMREIIASGATTIMVSHSMDSLKEICNRILWLDHGSVVEFGNDVEGIISRYVKTAEE